MRIGTTDTPAWTEPLRGLPEGAVPYSTERTVRTGDVDDGRRLRLDGIARYLQDIGTDNLAAADATGTDPLWIVRRTVIDVHRPASYPQRLRLRRWCDALSTRWANLRVRMDGIRPDEDPGNGDPEDAGALIETAGFWIDINPTSGAPTRISDPLFERMSRYAHDTRLRWHAWLSPEPPGTSRTATPFPLRVTDIDPFGHVNNTTYWHGVEEHLAGRNDLRSGPYRAVVEHLYPVVAGENLTIRTHHEDDALSLWFTVDDRVRAVARVARATAPTRDEPTTVTAADNNTEHLSWDA